jgi:replication factor C subunit 3/5
VKITADGKNALLTLSNGDMRRVLNLLQATHIAYPQVTEDVVYMTAGAAIPTVIKNMLASLLKDSFDEGYVVIHSGIIDFGFALSDIVTELTTLVHNTQFPDKVHLLLLHVYLFID